LLTSTQGQGSVSLSPSGGKYDADTSVELTATADAGWHFVDWSGDLSGSTNPAVLVMNADKSVTATFEEDLDIYTLSVFSLGASSVPISSSTGFGGTTNYTHTVNDGVLVVLTAPLTWEGATFTGWTGAVSSPNAKMSLTMDSSKTVTANYEIPSSTYTLSVNSSGVSSVPVTSTTGFSGTTDYTQTVDNGTLVILTALARSGEKTFAGWTGAVTSSSQTIWFKMTTDTTVTANYRTPPAMYTLSVNSVGATGVSMTSSSGHGGTTHYSSNIAEAETVSLTAPAAWNGRMFSEWSGAVNSNNPTIMFPMTADKSVTATYIDSGCVSSIASVNSILPEQKRGSRGRSFGNVTVTIRDNCGNPVVNAEVTGTFSGDYSETHVATTNAQGIAVFKTTTQLKNPVFRFCVDDINHAALTYNPDDNVQTCADY
jgi:hypothetical protein